MDSVALDCASVLGADGLVARRMSGHELRPQQLEMGAAVAGAFERGEHLLVEAGTGVGKSFAYLVPAIERVTRQGQRVVFELDGSGRATHLSIGSEVDMTTPEFPPLNA